MNNVRIVVDSSANLGRLDMQEIVTVPMKIMADGKEYVDNKDLDVSTMLSEIRTFNGPSSTACPSPGEWFAAFGDAKEVFGVALTSTISGAYNAAKVAAEDYMAKYPERRVFILDSLTTGPELELIVEKYLELIRVGQSFDEICEEIQKYSNHTHLIFSLESLLNFARNGRVNPTLAKIAGFLGIRIVGKASSHGELEPLHKCRGEKSALQTLITLLNQEGFTGGKIRIRHSDNKKAATVLAEKIKAAWPGCDITVGVNLGLCSYYAEKGGILVGFESGE